VQGFIRGFLERHFPEANIEVSRRWGGIHGMTSDGLPIVGHLPDEPEVYFAVGFSGHGNSLGLIAGERVVEMMVHGREPGVFSVGRFE
jgi:glycine/D-amino acid oxidase-like deaminating enzyme